MPKKYFLLLLMCFLGNNLLFADNGRVTIEEAVRLSAEQRVLAQRVAKVYIGLCNNIQDAKLYQERDAVIKKFEENLQQLAVYTPSDPIRASFKLVKITWKEYVAIAGWSIKKDDGAKLLKKLDEMLHATNQLNQDYKDYAIELSEIKPTDIMMVTNQINRQNKDLQILIERTMLYYLAEKSKVDPINSGHKLDNANVTFSNLLKKLMANKTTSVAIQKKYKELKDAWAGINKHLVFTNKDQSYVDDMYSRVDKIASNIDRIAEMYDNLGAKLSISGWMTALADQQTDIQKLTKTYVALAAVDDSLSYSYKKDIVEQVEAFEKSIQAFDYTAPDKATKEAVKDILIAWDVFKKSIDGFNEMNATHVNEVLQNCHTVKDACTKAMQKVDDFARLFEAYQQFSFQDGKRVAVEEDIVYQMNAIATLRIICHRMVSDFVVLKEFPDNGNKKRLLRDIQTFDLAYKKLLASKHNTFASQKLLESFDNEWNTIKDICENGYKEDLPELLDDAALLGKKLAKLNKLYAHQMNEAFQNEEDKK